jgi:sialate O-acetylesterase
VKKIFTVLTLLGILGCRQHQRDQELILDHDWKFKVGDSLAYGQLDFDDQHWIKLERPKMFNELGLKQYDGPAWYRCKVIIPSNLKLLNRTKKLDFYFGAVDDCDQFYLNGKLIGSNNIVNDTTFRPAVNQSSVVRKYEVEIGNPLINWDKENVIAIRVFDELGDGGLTTIPRISSSEFAPAKRFDLGSKWQFVKGDSAGFATLIPKDRGMYAVEVGQPWETEGLAGYDGFGWYFKSFSLPVTWKKKPDSDSQAVLQFDFGRIDDFDQVFLNGNIIGENGVNIPCGKKGGEIAASKYGLAGVHRLYNVDASDQRLHWDRDNVLAIRVFDAGGDGGVMNVPFINMISSNIAVDLTKLYKVNDSGTLDTIALITNLDRSRQFTATVKCKAVDNEKNILLEFSRAISILPGQSVKVPVSIPFSKKRVRLAFSIVKSNNSSIFFEELNIPFVLLKG